MPNSPKEFVHKHIRQMRAYEPGLRPQEKEESETVKLNTNENPFPPAPKVLSALEEALKVKGLHLYPDPLSFKLRKAIAEGYGLSPEHVLIGNGSDEILSLIFRAVLAPSPKARGALLFPQPSYSLYPVLAQALGLGPEDILEVPLQSNWHIDFEALLQKLKSKDSNFGLAVFANPNSPTSIAEPIEEVLDFVKLNPALSLIDEAYAPFWGQSLGSHAGSQKYPRLLVCGTFSKAYSLAGQRIGWLLAHPDIICQLDKIRDSYNLSYLAQAAALAAWQDKEQVQKRIQIVRKNRDHLLRELSDFGFHSLAAEANFIFTRPPQKSLNAAAYYQYLAQNRILVRHFSGASHSLKKKPISEYVRISVGRIEDIRKLLLFTKKCLEAH